jgi:hypothetical protein
VNQSKAYLKSTSKNLTSRSIDSYVSRLNRALKILDVDPVEFYRIEDPVKVIELMQQFENHPEYKTMNKGSKGDVMSAFHSHIEAVQILKDIKPAAQKYLLAYLTTYQTNLASVVDKYATANALLTSLVGVLSKDYDPRKTDLSLLSILGLKSKKSLKEINKVASDLSTKEYSLTVFNHFELTAKVMALKGLVRQLNADVKKHDHE